MFPRFGNDCDVGIVERTLGLPVAPAIPSTDRQGTRDRLQHPACIGQTQQQNTGVSDRLTLNS
jgi:hypothetical protein